MVTDYFGLLFHAAMTLTTKLPLHDLESLSIVAIASVDWNYAVMMDTMENWCRGAGACGHCEAFCLVNTPLCSYYENFTASYNHANFIETFVHLCCL